MFGHATKQSTTPGVFQGCTKLTGPSATVCIDDDCTGGYEYLYDRFPGVDDTYVYRAYNGTCLIDDGGDTCLGGIPAEWR